MEQERGFVARAGGLLVSSSSASPSPSPSPSPASPILELLFFHKAIRAELRRVRLDASALERGGAAEEFEALSTRFRFLHLIYAEHSSAEDEIIFPALDDRVKNVVWTYSLEHEEESSLFEQISDLLSCAAKDKENISTKRKRDLVCCTEAIETILCQHMCKEEEQIFPLLLEHFSIEEQATLVWQFLCSIPVNLMQEFLPWIASSLSEDEQQEMILSLLKIVPKQMLLRQVIFTWLKGGSASQLNSEGDRDKHVACIKETSWLSEDGKIGDPFPTAANKFSNSQPEDVGASTGKTGSADSAIVVADCTRVADDLPIDGVFYIHKAIRKELTEFAEEVEKMQVTSCILPPSLSSFSARLQFLAEVCIFHSVAEDKVLFPAVSKKVKHNISFLSEHKQEERQFDDARRLVESMFDSGKDVLIGAETFEKLHRQAILIVQTIEKRLLDKELKLLPLAREYCSIEEQRDLLYQSLRVMPLKLLERVLPWLIAILSEEEAQNMLQNIHRAAPITDTALVTLFSGWACKGQRHNYRDLGRVKCISNSVEGCLIKKLSLSASSCYCSDVLGIDHWSNQQLEPHITHSDRRALKRLKHCDGDHSTIRGSFSSCQDTPCCAPCLGFTSSNFSFGAGFIKRSLHNPMTIGDLCSGSSGLLGWWNNCSLSVPGTTPKPIDTIFQFHKAIRRDLEYLDSESSKLVDCSEEFLRQFTGRFRLLWGLYRAHSNAEDEIVFPALEAKESLHNVSHSYTIDHKQEEHLFNDISNVLSSLSHLQGGMGAQAATEHVVNLYDVSSSKYKEKIFMKEELASKLQAMCKSVRVSLDHHVSREELELWPLFDLHFTVEEQDKIVGQIIGTTGAEVLQTMLPWVTTALTQDEQCVMMDTWRQATRNTMFDEWLRAWWKGSPASSPRKSKLEYQDVPDSGTPESLQIVAEYLSKDVPNIYNEEKEVEISKTSIEANGIEGKRVTCELPASHASNDKELNKKKIQNCRELTFDVFDTSGSMGKDPFHERNTVNIQPKDSSDKFKPGWLDIFRMNQKELEAAMRKVSNDRSLDPRRKAYLMQNLLTSRWIVAQQQQTSSVVSQVSNDQDDIPGRIPSYHDSEKKNYGCEHYRRNCKIRAACCGSLFTCRFCHDKVSDHSMDRQATKEMMCMKCLEVQPVSQYCATPSCSEFCMARYYCNICKFFDDDNRNIYHCPFCNLCRVGKGLGVDYFHCMTCNACMSMSLSVHKCHEKGLESNCPICHEFLFTSKAPVKSLPCGHFMHSACFQAYTCSHYTCPICSKSLGDMAAYFGMLDALLASEELPEEYRDKLQDILCNDCEQKGTAPFHWLYHKCIQCGSYNTRVI